MGPYTNPFQINGFFHTIKSGRSIVYIEGLQFPKNVVFLSLKIFFLLANSVGPDEMLHYTAFHLGLYCFVKISVKRLVKELHVLCGTHYSGS